MRLLVTVLVLFTILSASPASAQNASSTVESALDDERPPVRAPLTIDGSFSLRTPRLERPHHGSDDAVAIGLYVTSITSFVVSLGGAFAWVGFRAAMPPGGSRRSARATVPSLSSATSRVASPWELSVSPFPR